jgi:cation diffusion facilitator CzcD-associated flavoprotein CzcO
MNSTVDIPGMQQMDAETFDVIVIGAGLSGVGTAVRLQRDCPDRDFILLERREAIGGTWDLFRYPGIRSDSDMHTLGYDFKPWEAEKTIADGPSILSYVNETADEYRIRERIRFSQKLIAANWSSERSQWQLTVETPDGTRCYRCGFLMMCAGYYSYDQGYEPEFEGKASFSGEWVHPQFWPENLDHRDKTVVVIGSGATAMTLVPNMARGAKKVTMLQRSPTYVVSRPSVDGLANRLRRFLPPKLAYDIVRWRNTLWQQWMYKLSRIAPGVLKRSLLKKVREEIGEMVDVEKHFTPRYNPWDQRLCLVPDDDLFRAIQSGKASVVTDHVEKITGTGVQLASGEHLDADIIVCATGLELVILGGAEFTLDGEVIDFANEWTYKGMMCSNIPNMVHTFGYINASWTLRSDLIATWVCRLLNHMRAREWTTATPRIASELAESMSQRFWIDDFSAGYMQRVMHRFPKQGDQMPWMNPQDYRKDRKMFRDDPLEDEALTFERVAVITDVPALQEAS